ncbi:MAG: cation:proton antiporter [Planctomycetota bacterium]|nr:cation:proton antiporter [Planctomycetota bacterium]
MNPYTAIVVVLAFTAFAGWANDRFLRLPSSIGVMLAGLVVAGGLMLAGLFSGFDEARAVDLVKSLHFDTLLVGGQGKGMAGQGILLGVLLFATALQLETSTVTRRVGLIAWMATVGVILTAIVTAIGLMLMFEIAGKEWKIWNLLLVGAILAPTDAVAAISLLRRTSAPKRVQEVIAGESLFNDGISIVVVLFLTSMLLTDHPTTMDTHFGGDWILAFIVEAGGAILLGIVMGYLGAFFVHGVKRGSVIVLITISIVLLNGVIAPSLFVSCPVACVVSGLVMGRSSAFKKSEKTGELVIGFWNLIENSLTAVLFLLIGLELLAVDLSWSPVLWSLAVWPLILIARFIALVIPWGMAKSLKRTQMSIWDVVLMTWCGLRGGVSIAMALAVPTVIMTSDPGKDLRSQTMVVTLMVVIGSILIQGMTVEPISRFVQRRGDRKKARQEAAAAE